MQDIQNNKLAEVVLDSISEGIYVLDLQGNAAFINPSACRMLGYEADELLGKPLHGLIHHSYPNGSLYPREKSPIYATLKEGQPQKAADEVLWRKDGTSFAVEYTSTPLLVGGKLNGVIVTFSDITERKKAEAEMVRQTHYDRITGLPNRMLFMDRLEQAIKQAHRTGFQLALMFIDLDRFKEVNDTLGYDKGDVLLKEAARRLLDCVRECDTVARLGGDEFAVVLGDIEDPNSIEHVAQDIVQKIAQPFVLDNEFAYISASVGVTLYPQDSDDLEGLLKNADQAMYSAKTLGRNRYSHFTPSMQEAEQVRMRMANDMRIALANGHFRVYYQPIVNLESGAIYKAEALLRWQHPSRGLIAPAQFLSIAEETGLIVDIGTWVFEQATSQAKQWRESHHGDFQISVNKSKVQFHNLSSHQKWFEHLKQQGLPGQGIAIDISEGLILDANSGVTQHLLDLRDAGIQVAIDDFGSGRSSLSYLKKFDIDYLKIDQSFVRNLSPSSEDMALCEAIIGMAHKLGLKVIAVGVETEEQRSLLMQVGCDYAQGFLFSQPVPAEEFEKLLNMALA